MKILVTGAAGFIGAALTRRLMVRGDEVIGIDNLSDYYDVGLKRHRLESLAGKSFQFQPVDIADEPALQQVFSDHQPDAVVNLAAQPGVRYSLEHPQTYSRTNLVGFANLLECCRHHPVQHLVFASSSSVYGANRKLPFHEDDPVDHPVSLYAASKKSNEMMAHSYAHLFGIPATGLRFFTVYGPMGRPDMAYFSFTRKILASEPIRVFNQGQLSRDFTYVDDIVEGVMRVLDQPPLARPEKEGQTMAVSESHAPYRILNIGNQNSIPLMDFIVALEECLQISARMEFLPMQPGDVLDTRADVTKLHALTGFQPTTPLREGLESFVRWYRGYYQ